MDDQATAEMRSDDAAPPDVGSSDDALADANGGSLDVSSSDDAIVMDADVIAADTDDASIADSSIADSNADIFVDVGDGGSCTPPTGSFICKPEWGAQTPQLCDRATQYCQLGPGPTGTQHGCKSYDDPDAGYSGQPFPPQCLPCPTCECVFRHTDWGTLTHPCGCRDLDGLGAIGLSCGGCYGSPPARLERWLRSVS